MSRLSEINKKIHEEKICLMKSLYAESLLFQYNSASSMYFLQRIDYDPKFGSNCYEQSKRLKERLTKAGIQTYYIEDTAVGRHRSLLCFIGDKTYYLDPYFMHKEPIELDSNPGSKVVDSYPLVQGLYSQIHLNLDKDGFLSTTKKWPHQKRQDAFIYDPSRLISSDITREDYFWRAFHPKQNNLSIRFLDVNNQSVDHLLHYLNNGSDDSFLIKTNECEKIPESDSSRFDAKLERLVKLISSDKKETMAFLQRALELHQELKEHT